MDEEYYSPKTIEEAIEAFMISADLSDSDEEVILNTPLDRIDWLHSNFDAQIRRVCGVNENNKVLLEACGGPGTTPHGASKRLMVVIWHYWRTGEIKY